MKTWKIILAVLLIFGAGAVTGAIVVRRIAPRIVKTERVVPSMMNHSPERRREYVERLDARLKLTPEQKQKIDQILTDSQDRLKTVWEEFQPAAREEFGRTRKEISELLTPEQLEIYKQMRKHREKDKDREKEGKTPVKTGSRVCNTCNM